LPTACAAATAITAVRTAEGDEFLAPEAGNAIAAVAGFNPNIGFIDEFHWLYPKNFRNGNF
jgi:hypothetical protein